MRLVTVLLALALTAALFVGPASVAAISMDRSDIAPDDEPEDCVATTDLLDGDAEVDASEYADCLKQQYEYELRMDVVATLDWIETEWPDVASELEDAVSSTISTLG